SPARPARLPRHMRAPGPVLPGAVRRRSQLFVPPKPAAKAAPHMANSGEANSGKNACAEFHPGSLGTVRRSRRKPLPRCARIVSKPEPQRRLLCGRVGRAWSFPTKHLPDDASNYLDARTRKSYVLFSASGKTPPGRLANQSPGTLYLWCAGDAPGTHPGVVAYAEDRAYEGAFVSVLVSVVQGEVPGGSTSEVRGRLDYAAGDWLQLCGSWNCSDSGSRGCCSLRAASG